MLRKLQSQYSLDVSVPSRGVRCLNEHISDHWDEYVDVFVPSRGIRYLNVNIDKNTRFKLGFRPLAGSKVSEHLAIYDNGDQAKFPSPLGD